MSEQVEPVVCIAHGAFVPCRRDGEHRLTGNPYWVKAVRDYQGSSVEGLTWEPAWELFIVADTQGTAAMSNSPDSTPAEHEAGEVGAIVEVLDGTRITANTWQSAARRLADENRRLRAVCEEWANRYDSWRDACLAAEAKVARVEVLLADEAWTGNPDDIEAALKDQP